MGTTLRLAGLAAVLATAGCVQPAQYYSPPVSGLGPPVPLNALPPLPPPVALIRPLPERPASLPGELPPLDPTYAAPAQPEPPFSDGTPFPDELPTYAEPTPPPPAATPPPEPPRPVVRAAEPTPAVPMVGFRPMRPPGSRSY